MAETEVEVFQNRQFISTYHYVSVCINNVNDAFIVCENYVKFDPVTPQLTELICERQVRHGQTRISANADGPCDAV